MAPGDYLNKSFQLKRNRISGSFFFRRSPRRFFLLSLRNAKHVRPFGTQIVFNPAGDNSFPKFLFKNTNEGLFYPFIKAFISSLGKKCPTALLFRIPL